MSSTWNVHNWSVTLSDARVWIKILLAWSDLLPPQCQSGHHSSFDGAPVPRRQIIQHHVSVFAPHFYPSLSSPSPRPVSSMCSTWIWLKLAPVHLTDVSAHSRAQRKRCWFGTWPGHTVSQRDSTNPRSASKMKHEILNTETLSSYSTNMHLILL